ncbi:hypothetical protein GY21_02205 [Cryobacterium roopkundense]|uniref:DNA modification methylase n=1 Tax=Cryobacterium roopkundense TaxID=1001240 RepID=A0A099JRM5_9MICO|nr:hypothetical protein [Cryobacterium roopkundense]KGJ80805.1 hypothetical protein GY21_02205 [Cryobacterium roopkundense]MBB5639704.1 hypothetical protein [Cryobacterium roopkundense]
MSARIVASVFLAAGILLGTSACGFYAPQATLIQYDPSDGVSGDVGEIAFRNAMLLSEDGSTASLLVTAVNKGDSAQSVTVQYEAGGQKVTENVTIRANSSVTIGTEDRPSVLLENLDAAPGDLFPVFFQYGEETGVQLLLPILDGTTGVEYADLIPTATPAA